MKKIPWEITIKPLDRGFFVRVGCKEFAVMDLETIVDGLKDLASDPSGTYERWFPEDFIERASEGTTPEGRVEASGRHANPTQPFNPQQFGTISVQTRTER